ncbi:CBS domain-containing protein [Nocardioides ultimimeridianus]
MNEGATTVAEVMITAPTTFDAAITVGVARTSLARPKQHLVLLVDGAHLVGTLAAEDLPDTVGDDEPARDHARLEDRTARPTDTVADLWERLDHAGARRLAVVDDAGDLLGLVCVKRCRTGFCTVEGIAAWRAERSAVHGS